MRTNKIKLNLGKVAVLFFGFGLVTHVSAQCPTLLLNSYMATVAKNAYYQHWLLCQLMSYIGQE